MLVKRTQQARSSGRLVAASLAETPDGLDRRTFLRGSGLAAVSLAALGPLSLAGVRQAAAGPPAAPGAPVELRKNICTHCSVGCTVIGVVQNGVWIGQEPGWDSPI